MSLQPYEQAVASTRSVLAQATAERMSDPTPCASWTVADLINHVIGGQHFFAAGMNGTPPSADHPEFVKGDFVAAFDEAAAAALAAFAADGALGKMVKMPFGEMPGMVVLGLATTDTFVHGWDLAKALGLSTDLNPELATALLAQSEKSISDGFRGPDGKAPFGAKQSADNAATAADKLAAFLGRTI
ncbi:MAG: TIGR03086 family metal-binding protein [Acidimicrobiia bacterium]